MNTHIRHACKDEIVALQEIDRQADTLFEDVSWLGNDSMTPHDLNECQNAGRVWVATDESERVVGFAAVELVDGLPHLEQLSVMPEFGRRGIGARLLESVCEWARTHEFSAMTLSTFRDIPWNGPFYAARGFVRIPDDELTPGLRALRQHEQEMGLDITQRVCMRRNL